MSKYNKKENAYKCTVDNSDLYLRKNECKTKNRVKRLINFALAFIILFSEFISPMSVFAYMNVAGAVSNYSGSLSEFKYPVNVKPQENTADTDKEVEKEFKKISSEIQSIAENNKKLESEFKTEYDKIVKGIKDNIQSNGGQALTDDEIRKKIVENNAEEYGELVNMALEYNLGRYAIATGTAWVKHVTNGNLKDKNLLNTETEQLYKKLMESEPMQNSDIVTFYGEITKAKGTQHGITKIGKNNADTTDLSGVASNLATFEGHFRKFIDINGMFGGGQIKSGDDSTTSAVANDPNQRKIDEDAKQKRIEESKKSGTALTQEELNKLLLKNKDKYDKRLKIYDNLNSLIKSVSRIGSRNPQLKVDSQTLDSLSADMSTLMNQNKEIMDKSQGAATGADTPNPGTSIENMGVSYYNIMPDIFNDDTKQLNPAFQGLFAWTANFTPFVTNVYDSDIKSRLNSKEEELYDKYSGKRSVVYMAMGEKGIAKGIRSGMPYQYKPISLAEFLDRADEKETVLFTKIQTFEVDVDEDEDTGSNQSTIKKASAGDADDIAAGGTTEKNASQQATNEVTETQKAAAAETTPKKTKTLASMPWKIVNGSVTDTTNNSNDPKPVGFIGPIYASSGKSYKEPWSLNDMGTSQIKTLLDQADPKLVENEVDEDKKAEEDKLSPGNEFLEREVKDIDRTATGEKPTSAPEKKFPGSKVSSYNKEEAGETHNADGSETRVGYIAIQEKLWDQYKYRVFWIPGYGYGEVRDKMGQPNRFIDVFHNTKAESSAWGVKDLEVLLMPVDFKPKELGNPNVEVQDIVQTPGTNDSDTPIPKEDRLSESQVNTMKKMMFEGLKETKLEDASIARFLGNNMNMNYFILHNTLMNKNQYSSVLEEDMNKPLYVDFIGNILTQSGYVVIPAAANYNYYNSPLELPMFNAAFLNSYPDLRMDETQQYTNTNSLEKQKFIYQKNKQGLVTISQLMRSGISQTEQFYGVPLQSRVRLPGKNKDINFMDDVLMFKPNVIGYANSKDEKDPSNNLVFVNSGAIIQKLGKAKDNVVNLKNISGNGAGVDWDIIKQVNMAHIDVEKSKILNQELLAANAVTTELTNDGVQSKVLTDYVSKDEQLRTGNSIIKVVGELFESLTMRIFALLPPNYVLYTPSPDNMIFVPNLSRLGQKMMFMVAIIAFLVYIFRFVWNIFTRNDFGIKSSFVSLIAIILISASTLWIMPFVINLLYNKPANMIMKKDVPLYVMEGIEQTYREESPMFFDTTGNTKVESNPSITIEKLKPRDAEYIRNETTQTEIFKTQFYMPTFDNTKVYVLGDKLYMQGRELKIDVKDLFDIVRIEDVAVGNNIKLQFAYSGYGEISNYMPFMQITEALTDSINDYNNKTKSPYRLIQYRKGLTKSTGRTEDFVKSIAFIAPDLLDEFLKDLSLEYKKNADTMQLYYNNYTMPDEVDNLNKFTEEVTELENETKRVNQDEKWNNVVKKSIQNELADKYKDIGVLTDAVDYLSVRGDKYENDWLQLSKVLMRPGSAYDSLFDKDLYKKMQNAKWFPEYDPNQAKDVVDKEIDRRIYIVNENTRRFVLDKMIPIVGHISDDTAIKIISMYATMEFNKEFKDFTDSNLYPVTYNTDGISNLYTSKSSIIPSDEIFITGVNKISLYLARESGVVGLILGLITQVALFIRMIIRITILSFVILTYGYVLLYLYTMGSGKKSMYLQGTLSSIGIFSVLYIIELFWYKASFYLTNRIGTTESLVIGLIPALFLTYIYWKVLWMILSDIRNFGYSKLEANVTGLVGRFYGIDMRTVYADPDNDEFAEYFGGGFDDYMVGGQGTNPYGGSGGSGIASTYEQMGNNMAAYSSNPYMAADNFSFGEDLSNQYLGGNFSGDDYYSGNGTGINMDTGTSNEYDAYQSNVDTDEILGNRDQIHSASFGNIEDNNTNDIMEKTKKFVEEKMEELNDTDRGVWGQRDIDLGLSGSVTTNAQVSESHPQSYESNKLDSSKVEKIFNEQTLKEINDMEEQLNKPIERKRQNKNIDITNWTESDEVNFLH